MSVCVYVCLSVPEAINNNGMIWTPYDWLNKGYSFHMAAVVVIGDRYGLRIEALSITIGPSSLFQSQIASYALDVMVGGFLAVTTVYQLYPTHQTTEYYQPYSN